MNRRNFFLSTYPRGVAVDAFVSKWNTANTSTGSSTSTQVMIPTESGGTYNCDVDWGDGNIETGFITYNDARWTHTYSTSGTYTITITGQCEGFRFVNTGDRLKILNVSSYGSGLKFQNRDTYRGCENLTSVPEEFPAIQPLNFALSFYNCYSLLEVRIPTGGIAINTFVRPFGVDATGTGSIQYVDVTGLDTSGASSFEQAFDNLDSLIDVIGLDSLDVTSVTTANLMFRGVTLPTATLSAIYIGWEAQAVQDNVSFDGGLGNYYLATADAARQRLIDDHTWTIVDGGGI